jgi:phosphate transport system permease protein
MKKDLAKYRARRRSSAFVMGLCWLASGLGLTVLFLILGTLIYRGAGALSLQVFTEDMPPPGAGGGGLRMAIVGSLIIAGLGTLIGTPIGILAGTYMAEYGRHARITSVIRFINDILLSAPSIVIGLFIYEIMIRPKLPPLKIEVFNYSFAIPSYFIGHYSGAAGAVALAVIVIPIVVRTTENMLLLVPNQLREAASAIGMPRALIIRHVAYKAAMAGMVTGILLAVARISGETAPLIFTSLGNQFLSFDLDYQMSSLPKVIFDFAQSADSRWIDLAWTGALLITIGVLTLSVLARWLSSSGVKS